jgi:hypothetical protein
MLCIAAHTCEKWKCSCVTAPTVTRDKKPHAFQIAEKFHFSMGPKKFTYDFVCPVPMKRKIKCPELYIKENDLILRLMASIINQFSNRSRSGVLHYPEDAV